LLRLTAVVAAIAVVQEDPMAVPKRKMSRSNTRHRRAQWKAATPTLVPITIDGVPYLVPQRLAKAYERGLLRPEG
jgi:large subunit ribosomal protein L32